MSFEVEPFDLPAGGGLPEAPITAFFNPTNLVLDRIPGLAEPVGVRDLSATVTVDGGEAPSITVEGRARHFGQMINAELGEPFWSPLPLAVGDVMGLLPGGLR